MKKFFRLAGYLLLVISFAGLSELAPAENSSEALLQKIQARSEKIKQFRALLNHPDQTTRLAALDVMLNSDDLAMRELAFSVCFRSAEDAMRAVCLKKKFADLKTIMIKVSEKENATEKEKKTMERLGGMVGFTIDNYDEKTGQFSTITRFSYEKPGVGQVSGTGIEFKLQLCNGTFVLGDDGILNGLLGCQGQLEGKYTATIRLQ